MSFEELYDSCFRHLPLIRVGQPQAKENAEEKATLDHALATSQFVAFLFTSGARGADTAKKLEHLVRKRNEKDKEKPQNGRRERLMSQEMAPEDNNTSHTDICSSPARLRRLFSMKKKKKKDIGDTSTVSVVVVDTDYSSSPCSSITVPGWYICNQISPTLKGRLLRSLHFEFPPAIIVVDSATHTVTTTEGRRMLHEDPNGSSFPWWPPSVSDLLRGPLVKKVDGDIEKLDYGDLKAGIRGLLFGAHWCPPSRIWTKQLGPVYQSLVDSKVPVEIIFCSSDRSQENFEQYLDQMPWVAFAYDISKTSALTRLYNVNGIPSLILIDKEGKVVSRHGKSTLMGDPGGQFFPWGPRPLYELDENSVSRLRDEPSLILFTEGTPEDVQFSLSVLDGISKKLFEERLKIEEKRAEERENTENGNSMSKSSSSEECSSMTSVEGTPPPDLLQIFYTGEDPICDHILEKILGLGDAELPLICIVDGLAGQLAVCEQPDVSEQVLEEFLAAFRAASLKYIPLPAASEGRSVGGIPSSLIEQAMANSPSQNSLGKDDQKIATN